MKWRKFPETIPHAGEPPYPWLSQEQSELYLNPLFLRGWYVREASLTGTAHESVLALRKDIPFNRPGDVANFARMLVIKMMEEKVVNMFLCTLSASNWGISTTESRDPPGRW